MALSTIQNNSLADTAVHGFRNLVINGACTISQRGTSTTGVTNGGYNSVDRFEFLLNTLGTWTSEQSTDAPDGFVNSHKLTATTADASPASGDYAVIFYKPEGQDLQALQYGLSGAKTTTISFWVKSNKTGNASFTVLQPDGSDRMLPQQYTINSANTWEYKSISIVGDQSGNIDNDNGDGIRLEWWINSGSTYTGGSHSSTWIAYDVSSRNVSNLGVGGATSDYFAITGVQLEVGSQATPFEHRLYADELARCKRYYERLNFLNTDYVLQGQTGGATTTANGLLYYTEKRTAPTVTLPSAGQTTGTITFLNPTGGYPSSTGSHVIQVAGPKQCRVYGSGYTGLTAGSNSILFSTGTTSVDVDAEL